MWPAGAVSTAPALCAMPAYSMRHSLPTRRTLRPVVDGLGGPDFEASRIGPDEYLVDIMTIPWLKREKQRHPLLYRRLTKVFSALVSIGASLKWVSPWRLGRYCRCLSATHRAAPFVGRIPQIGTLMNCDPRQWITASWYVRGDYERNPVAGLKHYLRSGMVCLDIGANAGFYTLLMARRVGPRGRVYAFEPTVTTFSWLGHNIALNELENVVAENVAVTDRAGLIEFRVGPPDLSVYNSISEVVHPGARDGSFERVFVPTITIDDYCATKAIDRVDCVKIDVEGAEFQALKGMQKTLASNEDIVLLVEFGQTTAAACGTTIESMAEWLASMGFQLSRIEGNGRLRPITCGALKDGEMVWVARSARS